MNPRDRGRTACALIALVLILAGAALVWTGDPTWHGKAAAVVLPLAMAAVVFWPTRRAATPDSPRSEELSRD